MEEKNVTLLDKETKIVDITKNLTSIFISLSSFSSGAVFELVHRNELEKIFISSFVRLDSINPDEFWLPHIDIDAILDAISEEDKDRDKLYLAHIGRTDGVAFCEYINANSEVLGEELTAYVNVLWSERSRFSFKACAAADRFNAVINAVFQVYKNSVLKADTRNVGNSNSEIADAIRIVGDKIDKLCDNLCDKLDRICDFINE